MGTVFMLIALYLLNFDIDFVVIFGMVYVLITLLVLYLHIEYYLINKGQEIIIESDKLSITSKNGNTQKFKNSELNKVILYKSASLDKGGIQFTPIESYQYLRIIAKSGQQIIITCLMYPQMEKVMNELRGVHKIRKKRLFCTLAWK